MDNIVTALPQVFNRLQKIQLCLSHKSTLRFLDDAAEQYDEKVHSWRESLLRRTTDPGSSVCLLQKKIVCKCCTVQDVMVHLNYFCRSILFTSTSQMKALMYLRDTKHHHQSLLLQVDHTWMRVWMHHPTHQLVFHHHKYYLHPYIYQLLLLLQPYRCHSSRVSTPNWIRTLSFRGVFGVGLS